jgi:hypothetical protein
MSLRVFEKQSHVTYKEEIATLALPPRADNDIGKYILPPFGALGNRKSGEVNESLTTSG